MPKRNLDAGDSDDDNQSLVNIDFDFFDPTSTDFIAIKRLLAQLFQSDAELLHIHELTELVLSQPLLGTTVKTDGIESDPYAFLTVLNLNEHKNHVSIKAITDYVLSKSNGTPNLRQLLKSLLGPSSNKHVGLILSERLINMPVQVAPPMYQLLCKEMKWAIEEKEPYNFSHYLCLSRTYRITGEDVMEGVEFSAPPAKRQKSKSEPKHLERETYSYHPEDEIWEEFAVHTLDYRFTNPAPQGADAAGLDLAGQLMLLEGEKLENLVARMTEKYSTP